jgi:DNA-binding transcriptional LysR family regulator
VRPRRPTALLASARMWETVDLRELRVFLTLAEELHFGRTAERLHLTSSRVSQSIRTLERKLGSELVYRTSRQVQLTAAGERFRSEAGAAYDELMQVLRRTQARTAGMEGVLRLGLLSPPAAGPHLLAIVDAFTARHPECRVEITLASWPDPFAKLRRGDMDVMASWLPLEQPDVTIGPELTSESRVLAVASDHPLAQRDRVSVEDLADECVPDFELGPKELHEAWIPSRTPSGRPIPRAPGRMIANDTAALAVRLGRGELVHPTVASARSYLGHLGVALVPIDDMPPLRSALIWRRRSGEVRVRAFVKLAREVLGNVRHGGRAHRAVRVASPA